MSENTLTSPKMNLNYVNFLELASDWFKNDQLYLSEVTHAPLNEDAFETSVYCAISSYNCRRPKCNKRS